MLNATDRLRQPAMPVASLIDHAIDRQQILEGRSGFANGRRLFVRAPLLRPPRSDDGSRCEIGDKCLSNVSVVAFAPIKHSPSVTVSSKETLTVTGCVTFRVLSFYGPKYSTQQTRLCGRETCLSRAETNPSLPRLNCHGITIDAHTHADSRT